MHVSLVHSSHVNTCISNGFALEFTLFDFLQACKRCSEVEIMEDWALLHHSDDVCPHPFGGCWYPDIPCIVHAGFAIHHHEGTVYTSHISQWI